MDATNTGLMTPVEMRKYLRISNNTLKRLMREGDVPALRVGRQIRFDRDKVVERLELVTGVGVASGE
jgi:excisionase family DNA binding protein